MTTRRDALGVMAGAGAMAMLLPYPKQARAQAALTPADWPAIEARARGQTVFFNAWGGDERTNSFIAWAGEQVALRYGVQVSHVKLRDTAEAVTKVVAERQAGRDSGGGVDLIWINGPNFLAMKSQTLLYGPFVEAMPNWRLIDAANKPSNLVDFTVPVDGFAAPWRLAQIVYVFDSARTRREQLPNSTAAMLEWARRNQGRLTHPNVRNFLGATFLKQALFDLAPSPQALQRAADDASFAEATRDLWRWYDELRPHLWRGGREFPDTGPAQRQLLADGELDLYIAFSPSEAAVSIANRQLPPSARVYVPGRGSIGNTSFVAIPYNAAHKEGAMVLANFLLDPATQARAQDPRILGSFSVLDLGKLAPEQRRLFARPDDAPALPDNEELGAVLPEPHPSWMTRITAEWERRYSR